MLEGDEEDGCEDEAYGIEEKYENEGS